MQVGAAKDGSDAAAWDRTTSFTQYRNIYKYAEIGLCSHPDVADDGDCTTAVVCTCGVTMKEAYDAHCDELDLQRGRDLHRGRHEIRLLHAVRHQSDGDG